MQKTSNFFKITLIYFISLSLFVGVRIIFQLGFLSNVNEYLQDILSTGLIQLVIMFLIPLLLYMLLFRKKPKQTFEDVGFKKISPLEIANLKPDIVLLTVYDDFDIEKYIQEELFKQTKKFKRDIAEVTEFFVDENNNAGHNTIYKKTEDGIITKNKPSKYLIDYLDSQGIVLPEVIVDNVEELAV